MGLAAKSSSPPDLLFSYKLGSEGKWNMVKQEEVTDGGYRKDSLITGFGERILHGDNFLIVAVSGKESQCSQAVPNSESPGL